jgi:hypothetical protein
MVLGFLALRDLPHFSSPNSPAWFLLGWVASSAVNPFYLALILSCLTSIALALFSLVRAWHLESAQ